jgi:nitric oxide reductase subunit B
MVRVAFWGLNAGLAGMMALDLFPGGVLQLRDVLEHGYWHARQLAYLMGGTFHRLEWARAAADGVFLLVGVVPLFVAVVLVLAHVRERETAPEERPLRR